MFFLPGSSVNNELVKLNCFQENMSYPSCYRSSDQTELSFLRSSSTDREIVPHTVEKPLKNDF